MTELIYALLNPSLPFLRNALIIGVLSSISFGVIGTFVVIRKISYIAGAISHSVLAGIGFALYAQEVYSWHWLHPTLGAFIAAIISAIIIGLVKIYANEREDSVIGAIWAVGMAVGLLFISKTTGYTDPMSYLFGNILIVSYTDLYLVSILDIIVIIVGILFFNKLQASSFDEEYTAIRGGSPNFYYFLILILTAITVVLMTTIVGIVMVIALLTIPSAISGLFHKRLAPIILTTIILTTIFSVTGIGVSYLTDTPSGPVIIVIAGTTYLLSLLFKMIKKKILT
ncbi:metal ABC transporter permease [Thiospirochaeta perfilievii]|uniref:Metal ABC transporter permease n=1 Tax=Thiospirochaeta perfilievii TaxID=252967 RepID=A0A5C1QBM5_9SPIO|nr:metal ABC transporter permease [Thiospirochaeta perfilievii]QEN04931.1 metal ABC transporter permease [Thiospirochaeta perfilievii]